jgi:glycolate oxidase iron-sulfur subunit
VAGVREGVIELDGDVIASLDTCVQCMGCLPACPSGVRYDRIIAPVVEELTSRRPRKKLRRTMTLAPLGRPKALRLLTILAAIVQRLRLMPRRVGLPILPLRTARREQAPSSGTDHVVVFSGCVMDAWYTDVHQDTRAVLAAMGYSVSFSAPGVCCGALHAHVGLNTRAETLERRVKSTLAGATIVVNSAGCGAHLRGTFSDSGREATRIVDVMEFIDENFERLQTGSIAPSDDPRERVVIHDACHLRNLQGSHLATHRVLGHFYDTLPMPDEGLCCGAGGAFAVEQPGLARMIVDRKFTALGSAVDDRTKFISSGNPGCLGHMTANKPRSMDHIQVVHPVHLIARLVGERKREIP